MEEKFVHLHVHSSFSLLDGLIKIPELFDRVKELNQPAIAITDHGNMFSMVDAAKYAQKNSQKFIPGCECYWVPDASVKDKNERSSENDVSRKHFLFLAKNHGGYRRLMKICSWGCTKGYYYRPRIDDSVLEQYGTDGIIASSACLAGIPAQKLLNDDYEGAKQAIIHYTKMFKDGYYLEIQPTNEERQVKINKGLIELSKELGLPLLATTDAHYLRKEDKTIHDVLLCIQSGAKLDDPNRWQFPGNSFYIMSRDEILAAFKTNGHEVLDQSAIEEAVNNTVEVANQCNVEFTFGKHYLPKINPLKDLKDEETLQQFNQFEERRINEVTNKNNISIDEAKAQLDISSEYLRFLCIHGWHGIYSQQLLDARHLSLLFYELDTIISMDFPSYFLILFDIMQYCQQVSLPTGCARGCGKYNNKVNVLNKGMQNISNIKEDDYVLALDNQYHRVLNVYEYDCDEDIIKMTTENNRLIEGLTKDHKILGIKRKDYIKGKQYRLEDLQWYPLDELNENDYLININETEKE